MKEFENIQAFIEEEKHLLNNHPLYSKIKTLEHI